MKITKHPLNRIRTALLAFVVLLVLSGITAFPVQTELNFMANHINWFPSLFHDWILKVNASINSVAETQPYLLYGYDWLAFAHIVIAMFFYGVYKDPIRNAWVLKVGMVACIGVFILAFCAAPIREIPIAWTLIDCSFGFFGIITLGVIQRMINQYEKQLEQKFINSPH